MTPLALIRHGPTEWNEIGRIQGQSDISLSANGRQQVAGWQIPAQLADFAWVASPLKRARETAHLLGAPGDLDVDPRLAEMHWGEWEGWTLERLRRDYGDEMVENESKGLDFRAAGGESYRDLQARLQSFLSERAVARESAIAVTHKGVIRAALSLATGWDMLSKPPHKLAWAAAHLFAIDPDGRLHVEALNLPLTDRPADPAL